MPERPRSDRRFIVVQPVQGHPAADQLQAYSRGILADEATSQAISSHLESCPACLQTLEKLSSDSLENLVRAAQVPAEVTPSGSSPPTDADGAAAIQHAEV